MNANSSPTTHPTPPAPVAWQPFTPHGVAAFARTTWNRVHLFEFIVALLASVTMIWFFETNCSPVITKALARLPDQAYLEHGQLVGLESQTLAQHHFLGFVIDREDSGDAGRTPDLQFEFGSRDWKIFSLLGSVSLDYYPTGIHPVGRLKLEPWWGAWKPVILGALALVTFLVLMLTWSILGMLYTPPARLLGFLCDRAITWGGSWRLACASLMPGGLFMIASIYLYGARKIDLVRFGLLCALHFVIPWIYLVLGTLKQPRLEKVPEVSTSNPFVPGQPATPSPPGKASDEKFSGPLY